MMRRRSHPEQRDPQAFSLLEMMMVLTLILLAATITQPREHHAAGARGSATGCRGGSCTAPRGRIMMRPYKDREAALREIFRTLPRPRFGQIAFLTYTSL